MAEESAAAAKEKASASFSVQPRVAFPAPDSATISWQAATPQAILYFGEKEDKVLGEFMLVIPYYQQLWHGLSALLGIEVNEVEVASWA